MLIYSLHYFTASLGSITDTLTITDGAYADFRSRLKTSTWVNWTIAQQAIALVRGA